MMNDNQFIGEIRMFTGNYAPKGWAFCNGAVFDPQKYVMLFSLLGYKFGEYHRDSPRLPDLRSRVPVNHERGSKDYDTGKAVGTETASIRKNMPGHYQAGAPTQFKATEANHSIIQPVLAVNFIIALEGIYPQRD